MISVKEDRKIVLIGVIHLGECRYFRELQALLDKYDQEGYVITYERMTHDDDILARSVLAQDPELAETVRRYNQRLKDVQITVAQKFQIGYQPNEMKMHEDWIDADISQDEMVKMQEDVGLLDKERVRKLSGQIDKLTEENVLWQMRQLMKRTFDEGIDPNGSELESKIFHQRDQSALSHIYRHVETKNVVAIWGVGHLLGISIDLIRKGWAPEDGQWVRAFSIEGIK